MEARQTESNDQSSYQDESVTGGVGNNIGTIGADGVVSLVHLFSMLPVYHQKGDKDKQDANTKRTDGHDWPGDLVFGFRSAHSKIAGPAPVTRESAVSTLPGPIRVKNKLLALPHAVTG